MPPIELSGRFHALGSLLAAHACLWRPAPFHQPEPDWCRSYPALARQVLALETHGVDRLAQDDHALIELLAAHAPGLAALHGLIRLPLQPAPLDPLPAPSERLLAHVPGRKQAQIKAFAQALGEVSHPLLEWCAGKGHLGRLVAWRGPCRVSSLEIDPALVQAGRDLARRAAVAQDFIQADALDPACGVHVAGRHVVALHACGDLHGTLLRAAVAHRVPALDLSPCCYYRISTPRYIPFCADAGLDLSRDELHLAVTETVTAGGRDRRKAALATAWKLAFLEWRARLGISRAMPFAPVPDAWLALGFGNWLARLCARQGLPQPPEAEWEDLEAMGRARHAQVVRYDLVRFAFRRALELWLVLDRAVFLERAGYAVTVRTFCARDTTPRNLLIQARRA